MVLKILELNGLHLEEVPYNSMEIKNLCEN
jgi:hypothetical protein